MKPVDAIVVGAGHNGLVAATSSPNRPAGADARARGHPGGAAVSASPFAASMPACRAMPIWSACFRARCWRSSASPWSCGACRVSSYTPRGDGGVLVCADEQRTGAHRAYGRRPGARPRVERFEAMTARVGRARISKLTEALLSRQEFRGLVSETGPGEPSSSGRCRSAGAAPSRSDVVRGIVATDGLIGTFATPTTRSCVTTDASSTT